jgi:predicted transposase YbfD/YdcC
MTPGRATIGIVESTVTRDGKISTERRFYLSSASLDAPAARMHRRIENCLYWMLDVGFDEDRARNRKDHGPENQGDSVLRPAPELAIANQPPGDSTD